MGQVKELEALVKLGNKRTRDLQSQMREKGQAAATNILAKTFQRMMGGSLRGALLNWRVKLIGVPLSKKQLVARYAPVSVVDPNLAAGTRAA